MIKSYFSILSDLKSACLSHVKKTKTIQKWGKLV